MGFTIYQSQPLDLRETTEQIEVNHNHCTAVRHIYINKVCEVYLHLYCIIFSVYTHYSQKSLSYKSLKYAFQYPINLFLSLYKY